ncbi:hypothetical protein C0991_008787 [Blastosporella zonata]|nr:hypothetical protein C0991_008787 [Blastosporella zonata]
MEIFNRPPTIAEDTLQYTLHPPQDLSDKASATTFAACIRAYVDALLPDFIWHRDAFELKVVADPDPENDGWILEGRMRVGDSVDDEWCTVWLLREISSKWDLVIRKRHRRQLPGVNEDEDRDNATNDDDDEYISAQDAINLIRDQSIPTVAPDAAEAIVFRRISG